MEIRKLEKSDKLSLYNLIKIVEENLTDKTFWLPITDKSRNHYFDDAWTYFLGAFDNNKLVGAVALFFNKDAFSENCNALKISTNGIAEYGRAMVHPDYRNKGIMTKLSTKLINYAKNLNLSKLVVTVHPLNIASQHVIKNLGFIKAGYTIKYDKYPRDILVYNV